MHRLCTRAARAVLVQGPRLLPELWRPAHDGVRRPPGRRSAPAGTGAPVGAEPAVPAVLSAGVGSLAGARCSACTCILLGFLHHRARRYGIRDGRSGSVTVVQHFGGGLNLNVHYHTLLFDGVFFIKRGNGARFPALAATEDEESGATLAHRDGRAAPAGEPRVRSRRLRRAPGRSRVRRSSALAGISGASIQGRIALGLRAGARVSRVGADPDAPWVLSTALRRAHLAGLRSNSPTSMCRCKFVCAWKSSVAICFGQQWRRTGSGCLMTGVRRSR